jgi:hypothetical protein
MGEVGAANSPPSLVRGERARTAARMANGYCAMQLVTIAFHTKPAMACCPASLG